MTTPRPYLWKEAQLISDTADETGATFHFYDSQAEMIYPNSGLKYKYGEVPDGHWEDLDLSEEDTLESTSYIFLKGDHPATGSLYLIGLDRGTKDILYLFRYDYERDISELVENTTLSYQSDNPIAQISAAIKNVKDSLFTKESSLFVPSSKLTVGIAYGKSNVYTLAIGYTDDVTWRFGARTVSLSGRNTVGYFLNTQTFDEDKSYSGTAVAILEDIFDRAGITNYEIDSSSNKTIEFEVNANDTFLKAVQIVSDLLSDPTSLSQQWDIEELYDGKIICGFAEFRGDRNPKGEYVFNGRSDIFATSINRAIDGSFTHIRCTGTDKDNKDLTPVVKPITTWQFWTPGEHHTYHAPKIEGLSGDSELVEYCKLLAKQMAKGGQITKYQTTLRPQLLVGDVASIQGQDEEPNEQIGIITEIRHSFGEKGYMTEFTASSSGEISMNGGRTYSKSKGAKGTDRTRRMSDFMGSSQEQNVKIPPQPKQEIKTLSYAQFNGQGHIELPITINGDYYIYVQYWLSDHSDGVAIFGNEAGSAYASLSIMNGNYYTSKGSIADTFSGTLEGTNTFILNMSGTHNSFNNTAVTTYTPTNVPYRIWIGGCHGKTNFSGRIYRFWIREIGGTDMQIDLTPAELVDEEGTRVKAGLYDAVSKTFYNCEGMTVG